MNLLGPITNSESGRRMAFERCYAEAPSRVAHYSLWRCFESSWPQLVQHRLALLLWCVHIDESPLVWTVLGHHEERGRERERR